MSTPESRQPLYGDQSDAASVPQELGEFPALAASADGVRPKTQANDRSKAVNGRRKTGGPVLSNRSFFTFIGLPFSTQLWILENSRSEPTGLVYVIGLHGDPGEIGTEIHSIIVSRHTGRTCDTLWPRLRGGWNALYGFRYLTVTAHSCSVNRGRNILL